MITTGAKRRHAVMMMLDPTSPVSEAGTLSQPAMQNSRRRTRSTRGGNVNVNANVMDAMEIEEEGGRERKRVARR